MIMIYNNSNDNDNNNVSWVLAPCWCVHSLNKLHTAHCIGVQNCNPQPVSNDNNNNIQYNNCIWDYHFYY